MLFLAILLLHAPSLFNQLDPLSVSKSLAFYELYPDSQEGKAALERVHKLLGIKDLNVNALLKPINRFTKGQSFSAEELALIEKIAAALPNRKLKGYTIKNEEEQLQLNPEEIDLGKGLLISQMQLNADAPEVKNYSAMLDLMALQVLSRVTLQSTPEEKIAALNQFIFEECRFRFPPHSLYAKEIDLYTFLPSVMDNHLGVCLGVTALYLALAERVALPLEIITPPGHIFLRYKEGEKQINIETTARGIHIPDDHYLGVNLKSLKMRNKKEVIGMTHVNQASVYLHQQEFQKAVDSYKKALPYLPHDAMVNELLGFSLLFTGQIEEGTKLLKEACQSTDEDKMLQERLAEDYLNGFVDIEGIKAIFMQVDEKRESIQKKLSELLLVVKKFPKFRAGLEQVAVSYLQLNRSKEALVYLLQYSEIDSQNPVIEYYIAALYGERKDYSRSWKFLKNAEKIAAEKGYNKKTLNELRKELLRVCPE